MNRSRIGATLVATALLVAGVQFGAMAATGKPLILGKANVATKTTVMKVKKSAKPALALKTKPNVAPLKVSSSTKVANLNADSVDGLDSSALATTAYTYDLPVGGAAATNQSAKFPGLLGGSYLVSYSIHGSGATDLSCFLRADTLTPAANRIAWSKGTDTVSSSDAISVLDAPSLPPYLSCGSSTAFSFGIAPSTSFSQVSTVTFLRLQQHTVTTSK